MSKKISNRTTVPNTAKVPVRGVELGENGYTTLLEQIARKRAKGEKYGVGQASSIILEKALQQGVTI